MMLDVKVTIFPPVKGSTQYECAEKWTLERIDSDTNLVDYGVTRYYYVALTPRVTRGSSLASNEQKQAARRVFLWSCIGVMLIAISCTSTTQSATGSVTVSACSAIPADLSYFSVDGGVTWGPCEDVKLDISWAGESVETPRGGTCSRVRISSE